MKKLPENVSAYKRTKVFSDETVANALLKTHYTKKGCWGKLAVLKGSLIYHIEGEEAESLKIHETNFGVIEPQVPHHIEISGSVEFYVEFYK